MNQLFSKFRTVFLLNSQIFQSYICFHLNCPSYKQLELTRSTVGWVVTTGLSFSILLLPKERTSSSFANVFVSTRVHDIDIDINNIFKIIKTPYQANATNTSLSKLNSFILSVYLILLQALQNVAQHFVTTRSTNMLPVIVASLKRALSRNLLKRSLNHEVDQNKRHSRRRWSVYYKASNLLTLLVIHKWRH